MKKNLLLCLFFSSICIRALAQCDCPASPTNISFVAGYPVTIDKNPNDVAWDVAPVDANTDGITDWYVVVGSTVANTLNGKDAFAMKVNLDGTTTGCWYYTVNFENLDEEIMSVFITSQNKILLCGTARTDYLDPGGTKKSDDIWVQKLNLNGTVNAAWSSDGKGHFYGRYATGGKPNPEFGFDIAEGPAGKYVIVGTVGTGLTINNDVVDPVQGNDDVLVLQVDGIDGHLLTNVGGSGKKQSLVWYDNTNSGTLGRDHAASVVVDCNTGHYIVSTHCGSCESGASQQTDVVLLDIDPADFHTGNPTKARPYGTATPDQTSNAIIQSYDNSFGSCGSTDGFVSMGLLHQCFSNSHNFYGIKTKNDLEPTGFVDNCTGNEGIARGGVRNDYGTSVVQCLDGYLLAGYTNSNALADGSGEVSCNHYDNDCTEIDDETNDFWLAHVNACTGALDWNESIGKAEISGFATDNERCNSIKRLSDDSYVMVGSTDNASTGIIESDIYIARFTITKCNAPTNLTASATGCTINFNWDGSECGSSYPQYHLQYKLHGTSWSTATNLYVYVTQASAAVAPGNYDWRVQTLCSSTLSSVYVDPSTPVYVTACRIGEVSSQGNDYLLSIYPNPSNGNFETDLLLNLQYSGTATCEILDQAERIISSDRVIIEDGLLHMSKSLDLPSGFYLMRTKVQGTTYQAKLIIQKN